jgi:acyl-CoA synthetase (AMP-forming)/AMP-acid ligase II
MTAPGVSAALVVAYVTLGSGAVPEADLETMLREHVGRQIGKLARPSPIIWADDLPKTRSGKIMRRLLRDIAEDREPGDVTTRRVGPGAAPAQCPCREVHGRHERRLPGSDHRP